jgi:hypothetical protein
MFKLGSAWLLAVCPGQLKPTIAAVIIGIASGSPVLLLLLDQWPGWLSLCKHYSKRRAIPSGNQGSVQAQVQANIPHTRQSAVQHKALTTWGMS